MTNWIDEFIEGYSKYRKAIKCIEKDTIEKQAICLLKLNAPKKKKKKKKRR